jgi:hypothetical protein
MPPPVPSRTPSDFDTYRQALRDAIERSTLRSVAESVGMSPTGLQKLVDGTEPRAKTRERIREWYVQQAGLDSLPPRDAVLLLRRLVGELREPELGVLSVLEAVGAAYCNEGASPPAWVEAVRREMFVGERPTSADAGAER